MSGLGNFLRLFSGIEFSSFAWLGFAAIALMLIHSVWATIAISLKHERVLKKFHTFSVHVWALWMLSLASGFAFAIPQILAKAGR